MTGSGKGNTELDSGPATLRWWTEHARPDVAEPHVKSDEEKHLEISRIALNRSETANSLRDVVLARAEETLRLFAATLTCQSTLSQQFPLERYFERGTRRTGTH